MDKISMLNRAGEFKLDEALVKELAEQAEERALEQAAQEAILKANEKPEEQEYIQRLDTKDLIKTDEEYQACVAQQVPLKVVRYSHALQILKETDARARQRKVKKKAKKVARASRKANRR